MVFMAILIYFIVLTVLWGAMSWSMKLTKTLPNILSMTFGWAVIIWMFLPIILMLSLICWGLSRDQSRQRMCRLRGLGH